MSELGNFELVLFIIRVFCDLLKFSFPTSNSFYELYDFKFVNFAASAGKENFTGHRFCVFSFVISIVIYCGVENMGFFGQERIGLFTGIDHKPFLFGYSFE